MTTRGLATLLETIDPVAAQTVPLAEAVGRVAARDVGAVEGSTALLRTGVTVGPDDVEALATAGATTVAVRRRPQVAVLCARADLATAQALAGWCTAAGAHAVVRTRPGHPDPAEIEREPTQVPDLVLVVGAAHHGALARLAWHPLEAGSGGPGIDGQRAAAVSAIGDTLAVSLPGDPAQARHLRDRVVTPLLDAYAGRAPRMPAAVEPRRPALAPPTVAFVAKSGTGKTTFLERLLPELAALGLRVGVVKHHAHPTPFDLPGKDTYRLEEAGAAIVLGACPVQVAVFRRENGSGDLDGVIAEHLGGMDLVLIEGFKRGSYPKVELHRSSWSADLLCEDEELLAIITDEPLPRRSPQHGWDDLAAVARLLGDLARVPTLPAPGSRR